MVPFCEFEEVLCGEDVRGTKEEVECCGAFGGREGSPEGVEILEVS